MTFLLSTETTTIWGLDPSGQGFTNVSNRPFLTLSANDADRGTSLPDSVGGSEGWDGRGDPSGEQGLGNIALITDATAPMTPSSVLRTTYNVGQGAGAGPVLLQTQGFPVTWAGINGQSYYIRLAFKWDMSNGLDWYPGTNKMAFFPWQGASTGPFLLAWASGGASDLSPVLTMNMQDTVDDEKDFGGLADGLLPSTGEVFQGTWQRFELLLTLNSSGTADGISQAWLDGTEIWNVTNIHYVPTTSRWDSYRHNPIRGGLSNDVSTEYYLDLDSVNCWLKA